MMEIGPTPLWFDITVAAILILMLGSIVTPVLIGLVHGLSALRAMRDHPNGPSLRLVALNLLEPSVTTVMPLTFMVVVSGVEITLLRFFICPLISVISSSLMLLAPFFTPATLPLRNTIATWGRLRWINTVFLWIAVLLSFPLGGVFAPEFQIAAFILSVSGVVILWRSAQKLLPVLRELRAVAKA